MPSAGIKFDPEAIAIALFILLGQANYPFKSMDRRGRIWENVDPADQPHFSMIQDKITGVQDSAIGLQKWTMHFWLLVYIRADANPETIFATEVNASFKALSDALNSSPNGNKQTLGGLVNNAWINGQTIIAGGIFDQQVVVAIPVDVEVGI